MQIPTKSLLVPRILFFVAIVYSIALLVLSLVNLKSLPRLEISNVDKIFHATAYFGLVVVWYVQYFANSSSKNWQVGPLLFIGFLAAAFGILVEILQGTLTSYRSWDKYDMLANVTGVFLAFVFLFALKNTLQKLKMKI